MLEAVDEGLLILGESGRQAIYFHLQNLYSLKKEDIPNNLKVFADGLRKIFGQGAEVIEKRTIKTLYNKLGINYEEKRKLDFLDYVENAKKNVAAL